MSDDKGCNYEPAPGPPAGYSPASPLGYEPVYQAPPAMGYPQPAYQAPVVYQVPHGVWVQPQPIIGASGWDHQVLEVTGHGSVQCMDDYKS